MPNTFLHIIVLAYKNFESTTKRCLDSLLSQALSSEIQTLVVDNGSPDNSGDQLRAYQKENPHLEALYLNENLGFAGGMNYAVDQTYSDWVMLVGNDTIFTNGVLSKFHLHLLHMPKHIGIVGPLTNEAGTAQRLVFADNDFISVEKTWSRSKPPTSLISPLYRADFFCVAIRRSLWDELNGIDLSYGRGYYEDFDFCLRARKLGYECAMLEDCFVFHQGSASFKDDPEQKVLIKNNKKIFLGKFPDAEMRHRRFDNFKTIETYLDHKARVPSEIINWRLQMLQLDLPRSPIKKMLWKSKIAKLTSLYDAEKTSSNPKS